jgi:hypothetical protein
MIKKIKKLLGICEHNWAVCSYGLIPHSCSNKHNALQFVVDIICDNCGEHKVLESQIFDESSIADDYDDLKRKDYWHTASACTEALLKGHNAKIVWISFAIKCKKKYNIDIKAKYHI